jgi:hypothetical protein
MTMAREPKNALIAFFNTPRKRRGSLPQYEIVGSDGKARSVDRIGRKFKAGVAPGVTGEWDSIKQARSEGYTVRRRA